MCSRSLFKWLLKFLPAVGTVTMTIHIGLLLMGIDLYIAEFLAGASVGMTLLLFSLSLEFDFCNLHKVLIVYNALTSLCTFLRRMDVFGPTLTPARWVMFSIGAVLIMRLFLHLKQYHDYEITRRV